MTTVIRLQLMLASSVTKYYFLLNRSGYKTILLYFPFRFCLEEWFWFHSCAIKSCPTPRCTIIYGAVQSKVSKYFSICLLTDLWDCWLLLTTCLSIILGYHKSLSHNRVLGLTQKFGFVNWLFKNSIYHCTKIGIKWRMIFPVVNAIYVIAYEAWKKFRASMGFEPVASRY